MTNRELLNCPPAVLSELDRQRLFLLRVESTPMPCPACKKLVNALDAAGVPIDAYDFGKTDHTYCCPHCQAELDQVVPAFSIGPLWYWEFEEVWLTQQLSKARALDQQGSPTNVNKHSA